MNYFTHVLKNYATFSGRATRSEYWYFTLIAIIINILLVVIDIIIGTARFGFSVGMPAVG